MTWERNRLHGSLEPNSSAYPRKSAPGLNGASRLPISLRISRAFIAAIVSLVERISDALSRIRFGSK